MAKIKKDKDTLYSEAFDEFINKQDTEDGADPNTMIERNLGALICQDISIAESDKQDVKEDIGLSIEDMWEDEYKILRGGGLQWATRMAYRSRRDRLRRPNSEDNFVHNAIEILTANLTATPIEPVIRSKKTHAEHAQKVQHMSRYNNTRNRFDSVFKNIVHDFVAYGPAIVKVCWDETWIGGQGPDRFVGEVKIEHINKEDFIVDPSVMDLERDLQKCKFAGVKSRQSVKYVQNRWKEFGKYISADSNKDYLIDEGNELETVTLYEVYYRGFPEYMPKERKKELLERAMLQEEQGDTYKAKDLYDMAKGNLEGVHKAYYCNDILLEYVPYEYDHGLYPFAFTTRYRDIKNQWGYGEIRNIKIPQLLHNKADEIELEAMVKEGLGGGYYDQDAMDDKQLQEILKNGARSGMWFAVNRVSGLKERTGAKVPASIREYKEHKQRMCETVSSNTPIMQGMSPGSNVPFATVQELGSRTDIRTKSAGLKLRDLLEQVERLKIELFAQFYTEERYYRYTDSKNDIYEGTFTNDEIFDVWARETVEEPMLNPDGTEMLDMMGQPVMQQVQKNERFVPDFDIEVAVISKRPNDRDYHTQVAFQLSEMGIMGPEHLLYTLEEGQLPEREEIMEDYTARNQVQQIMQQLQELPPEAQQMAMKNIQQAMQASLMGVQQAQGMLGGFNQ